MSSSSRYFLDTCVPIYAVGRDHPYREPCLRIVDAIGAGTLTVATDVEVIQEIAHRFQNLGRLDEGLRLAYAFLRSVEIVLPLTRQDAIRALELLRAHPGLSPRDALHVAVMEAAGLHRIVTADRHFDGVPGIERVDPMDLTW